MIVYVQCNAVLCIIIIVAIMKQVIVYLVLSIRQCIILSALISTERWHNKQLKLF